MAFVQADNLSLAFGNRDILDGIQINLDSQSRVALCGSNGSGKSTLMKILAGIAKSDSGKISTSPSIRIAYLPQTGITHKGKSVLEEMQLAYSHIQSWIDEKKLYEEKLAQLDSTDENLPLLLEQHYHLEQQIQESGFYEQEKAIYNVLTGLGFSPNQFNNDCSTFSGGWQMRIALAVTLLKKPDIMLLDEPTNYLDIEAREWLTQFLLNSTGGYLLVSHDRYFLDATVNEIYEIFQGDLKKYKGSYSAYEAKRAEELETLINAYKKQEEEIERNEQFIRRFRAKASKATLVQSRVKLVEKIQRIELPDNMKKVVIRFPDPPRCGDSALSVDNLSRSYGDNTVLTNVNFHIRRGEKVAFTGVNGAGKTTLLKAIAGVDKGYTGNISMGSGVSIGYFAQESGELLDESLSIAEEIEKDCPTEMIPKIRSLAGAFLFTEDDIFKQVAVLSGGERNRLTLLKLMLKPHNFLILDEPTNHLDIHSKDILLDALQNFPSTIIFVSHDRYFVEKLAQRVIHLEKGSFKDYPGDYQYYLYRREQENNYQPTANSNFTSSSKESFAQDKGQKSHQENKELRNKRKALEKKEEELLTQIDELESQLLACDDQLALPEIYSDSQKATEVSKQKEGIQQKLHALTEEWETISASLEEIKNNPS